MTRICVSKLIIIGLENGLIVASLTPSHYLNQRWNIVNAKFASFNSGKYIWKVVCEMIFLGLNVLKVLFHEHLCEPLTGISMIRQHCYWWWRVETTLFCAIKSQFNDAYLHQ